MYIRISIESHVKIDRQPDLKTQNVVNVSSFFKKDVTNYHNYL